MPPLERDVIFSKIFNDEQRRLHRELNRFSRRHIAPFLVEMNEREEVSPELIKRLRRRKLFGIGIPKKYGGRGGGLVSACIRDEALGYGSGAVGLLVGVPAGVAASTILFAGTEKQKQNWVRQIAAGTIATFQLTEPDRGSDTDVQSTVRFTGRDATLNGNKVFVTNGKLGKFGVVIARTPHPTIKDKFQNVAVIVPDIEKYIGEKHGRKMGLKASHTSIFHYVDTPLSFKHVLGLKRGIGIGRKAAFMALDKSRVTLSAIALGMARRAYDETLAHYKGQVARRELSDEQMEYRSSLIGKMNKDIQAMRRLVYTVAAEYAPTRDFSGKSIGTKIFASETLNKIIQNGLKVIGAPAYTENHPLGVLSNDAKVFEIFEGANEAILAALARQLTEK
ncbi:MAG TPA: acyl-CoA dehydrogenase family protein [Candidatus Norongarragalinales archaeon]|nr:acyl-CoA dehydrogenase family protein [Candidatus Norongarragalinales archaeon]